MCVRISIQPDEPKLTSVWDLIVSLMHVNFLDSNSPAKQLLRDPWGWILCGLLQYGRYDDNEEPGNEFGSLFVHLEKS